MITSKIYLQNKNAGSLLFRIQYKTCYMVHVFIKEWNYFPFFIDANDT